MLAFGFASPALLGWLALAAVPVLIHWLFRRRYREVTDRKSTRLNSSHG